jgi:hypothetical protein
MKDFKKLQFPIITVLTVGLMPYTPPHIVGKVEWVLGGAKGMQPMDYFDLVLHGAPWVYLIIMLIVVITSKVKSQKTT